MIAITKERRNNIRYLLDVIWIGVLLSTRSLKWISVTAVVLISALAIITFLFYRSLPTDKEKNSYLLNNTLVVGVGVLILIVWFIAEKYHWL